MNVAHGGLLSLNDSKSKCLNNYLHGLVMAVARQKQHGYAESCYLAAILQTTLCRPGEAESRDQTFNHSASAWEKIKGTG